MTKKDIEKKANFKPPLWSSIIIWSYFIIISILNPYKILGYIIGIFVIFFSVGKTYSLAKRLDKKGILAIWLGLLFGLFGLFFYYIYYLFKIKEKK